MPAYMVNGKDIVSKLMPSLRTDMDTLALRLKRRPRFHILYVGDDPGSKAFIGVKEHMARDLDVQVIRKDFPCDAPEKKVRAYIRDSMPDLARHEAAYEAYIIQLPLPDHIPGTILEMIPELLDVDRLSEKALGMFLKGRGPMPPIIGALEDILHIDELRDIIPRDMRGMRAVVIGVGGDTKHWGQLIGFPVRHWLETRYGMHVASFHRFSPGADLEKEVKRADIVISAVGSAHFAISGAWIKQGAFVFDAGFCRREGKLAGDIIDHAIAKERAALFAPSPGGIGILTVCNLFRNLVTLGNRRQ